MTRKEVKEPQSDRSAASFRRHPNHDRFSVRRLGLAALLIAVAIILLVVLPSLWPI
jgi:hypothetical protein